MKHQTIEQKTPVINGNLQRNPSLLCAVNAPKALLLLFYGGSITAKDQTIKMSKKKGLALFINDHLCGEHLLIKLENSAPFKIKLTQRTILFKFWLRRDSRSNTQYVYKTRTETF